MLKLNNVSKFYNNNGVVSLGLKNISLELNRNEIVAICGESGSGKSTLLNVLTKMDTFDEGEIYFKGEETSYFDVDDMDKFRKNKVGFIFQNYNIIESYTVLNNVMLPFIINGYNQKEAKEKALDLIKKVGLSKRIHNRGSKLSGGEKQRCVIARALAYDCEILACDEPTGNLDSKTGKDIINLIKEIAPNKLVLIVTHNFEEIKDIATRKIILRDGEILSDEVFKEVPKTTEVYEEPDTGLVKTKNVFKIALDNILNTPKKTIFVSLVYLILSFVILISFCLTNMSLIQLKTENRNNFPVVADNTVYVANSNTLNEDDFVDYKKSFDKVNDINSENVVVYNAIESLESSTLYMQNSHNFESFSGSRNSFDAVYLNGISKDVTFGRLAKTEDEINVAVPCITSDKDAKSLVNEIITLSNAKTNKKNKYKITGVKVLPVTNRTYKSVLFGNEIMAKEMRYFRSYVSVTYTKNDEDHYFSILSYQIKIDNNQTTTLYLNKNRYSNIEINSINITEIFDYSSNNDYNELKNVEVKYTDEESYLVLGSDYKDSKIYYAFIYNTNAEQTIAKLGNNGVFAVDMKNYICRTNYFDLSTYSSFISLIIVTVFALYFVTYFILRIIYKSKINDFNIMRTLGVTVKSMRKIVSFELLTYSIVVSVLVLLINIVCHQTIRNEFFQIFDNLNVLVVLFYFIFIILLSLLISNRFNNRLFKFSVNSSFERRGK